MLIEFIEKNYNLDQLKPYENFLIECGQKDYLDQGTHMHHILPKFMKGSNNEENLIKLNYQDHFQAHIILAECFQENTREYRGNILSANHITSWLDSPVDLAEKMSIAQTGRTVSSETREKLRKFNLGKIRAQEGIDKQKTTYYLNKESGKTYPRRFGRIKKEETKQKHKEQLQKNVLHIPSGMIFATKSIAKKFLKTIQIDRGKFERDEFVYMNEVPDDKTLEILRSEFEYNKNQRKLIYSLKMAERNKRRSSIPIKHIETGIVFSSIGEAKDKLNLSSYCYKKEIRHRYFIEMKENDTCL